MISANGSPRVLVVDDDPAIVRLMSLVLRSEGYSVLTGCDGQDGLVKLSQQPCPDLIVLDLQMPGVDGRDFYREARASGFSGPVIICSAFGAEAAQGELGADGALAKPFAPEGLLASVKELLNGG